MSDTPATRGTVVYIGNFELPDGNGAAQRVRGNARIFRDLGFRVVLVGVANRKQSNAFIEPVDSIDEGVEGYQIAYPASTGDWLRRITSKRMLTSVVARAQIDDLALTICYNYPATAQYRIARETRRLGGLAISDCTEWYAQRKNNSAANIVKNLDTPLRMHAINRWMDGLITTSPFITDFYQDTELPIVELPTIVPLTKPVTLPEPRTGGRVKLILAGSGFDPGVALQGSEGLKDRLDWVLELLAGAKRQGANFKLDVFGATIADYLILMPSQAGLLEELADELEFHGRVPHAALLDTLTAADFSIFMRKETRVTMAGFPGKFSESVSYGTPVISTLAPSTKKWMQDGETGFVIDPTDFDASVARLATILKMPPQDIHTMKQYCANSKMFAHESFMDDVRNWLEALSNKYRRPHLSPIN